MEKTIRHARDFAVNAHRSTNHLYDGQPYEKHLEMVVWYAEKYSRLINGAREEVIAAAWLHDVIEDCRVTYNDVLNQFGFVIAELVYALTNEKGRTRKDRANRKYYEGIREIKDASFLKICDRLANVAYSAKTGSSMIKAYRKEADEFYNNLFIGLYMPMFDEMDTLLSPTTQTPSIGYRKR